MTKGGESPPPLLIRGLLLNGVGGLVFGFAYWQVGLEAAMLAHLTADLVLLAGRWMV